MTADFVTHVRNRVVEYRDTRSYIYVRDGLTEQVLSYARLDEQARSVAAWLTEHADHTRPVLLAYRDAIDFLPAFLGCLYAGVVAVPAPLPHDARSQHRVAGIFDDAAVSLVLTTADDQDRLAGMPSVATDTGPLADPDSWRMPDLDRDTIAFLQYTSGSTSQHKGVVVTHGNLLHNEAAIARVAAIDDRSTAVGWLPHFHDMGLVGQLLQPIHSGANAVLMSPVAFLKRPRRWLELIHRYRGDVTAAPNFAYELLTRVTDLTGLDLSSLRVAMNGAEPIRARSLELVGNHLSAAGFAPSAFLPCYGLAEATLCATAGQVGRPYVHLDVDPAALERDEVRPLDGGARLISSGRPVDLDLHVVDPRTQQVLPDDRVGEIWLRGGSVAAGYWNQPQETERVFRARTADGDGPFLRTGDLGFRRDGELFVTGRRKDLLIINGRNLYPQDIEDVVRQVHPALANSPGAAFSVEADRERAVVVQGVRRLDGVALPELVARIKVAVARAFAIPAPSVLLVPRNAMHLTTSGKVRRRSMRDAFLKNQIEATLFADIDRAVGKILPGGTT